MTKVDRVGPMLKGIDTPPRSLRHERGHLRYHHRSSMGETKVSDGLSENCLDGVISLCLKSGHESSFATNVINRHWLVLRYHSS